ncbi:class I SAM-dependent methyltransferase [Crenobacter sp. SG2305]|uniref:class I SAM-dependent methyltransferase n=1 Tax=Crenobacter oryzisoli TaxID=3056844 RepID=UPI0025AB2451|nr:class I SAM-dependent methyltransferase [Crenobacter sp. SG2305]MDN0083182.1 class I SAM-dependent methyltransferase [Crenobacter sp. SG2305]
MSDAALFWNPKFSASDYVYGTDPNDFLRQHSHKLPAGGAVLSLGEGEGRNAVYLAEQGFTVTALDAATAGLIKVSKLAERRAVSVKTLHADLNQYKIAPGIWHGIVSVFCHLPAELRARVLREAVAGLVPGGMLLMEGYTPRQLAFGSGGPKDIDLLLEPDAIRAELEGLELLHFAEVQRIVQEGRLHTGMAAVLQVVARKPLA